MEFKKCSICSSKYQISLWIFLQPQNKSLSVLANAGVDMQKLRQVHQAHLSTKVNVLYEQTVLKAMHTERDCQIAANFTGIHPIKSFPIYLQFRKTFLVIKWLSEVKPISDNLITFYCIATAVFVFLSETQPISKYNTASGPRLNHYVYFN